MLLSNLTSGGIFLEVSSIQAVKSATTEEANFWLSLRRRGEEEEAAARLSTLRPLYFDGVAVPFFIPYSRFYYVFYSYTVE